MLVSRRRGRAVNRWLKVLLFVYVIVVTLIIIGGILQAWNW